MKPLFSAESIGKSFGTKDVLKAASVWAVPGRISVVMGRNGSGKTTLLRSALGVYTPDFGSVRYDGRAWIRPRLWRFAAAGLFYLPDRGLLGRRGSLADQLRLFQERFSESDPTGVIEQLGVADLLDWSPPNMSAGERRRAELALAISRRPRCLIADEPLTEVEPKDRRLALGALRALAEGGCAVLLTGHEVEDLLGVADEVIWMVGGTTHGLGPPGQARQHEQFRREYLGPRA